HSSKSTHSESNSSGSSGYGGKPSSSGYSSNNQSQIAEKRNKEKELKKKRPMQFIQSDLKANMAKKAIQKIPLLTPVFEFSKAEIVSLETVRLIVKSIKSVIGIHINCLTDCLKHIV
ncbi:jg3543, partial [Pararge aegeria aegeria]